VIFGGVRAIWALSPRKNLNFSDRWRVLAAYHSRFDVTGKVAARALFDLYFGESPGPLQLV